MIWKALGSLVPAWGENRGIALALSAAIGLLIYYIGDSDPAKPAATRRTRVVAIVIAIINVFVIYSAVIGLTPAISPPASRTVAAPANGN